MSSPDSRAARISRRTSRLWIFALAIFLTCSSSVWAVGPLFYATAPYVAHPPTGGAADLSGTQFLGTRFLVTQPIVIDGIGGNFIGISGGNIWGALVSLSTSSDYPDSTTMTSPDVLAHILFDPPAASTDLVLPIGPVSVSPGFYAVVYGGGSGVVGGGNFGTHGEAGLPNDAAPIGTPPKIIAHPFESSPPWADAFLGPFTERITVYATVPEPLATVVLPLAAFLAAARSRRRH